MKKVNVSSELYKYAEKLDTFVQVLEAVYML